MIGDGHHRQQNRIVSKGSEDDLINFILVSFYDLSEIPLAQDSVEGLAASGIVGAEHCIPIAEKPNAGPVVAVLGRIVIQEFWRTFVLPYLYVSIIRHRRYDAIIPYLMRVVGGSTPLLVNRRQGLRVSNLIAGVPVSGQAELICDPFTEIT
jgi:hypothetical protein